MSIIGVVSKSCKDISDLFINIGEYIRSLFANCALYVTYKVEIEVGDIAGFPKLNANLVPCTIDNSYVLPWNYRITNHPYTVFVESTKNYLIDKTNSLAFIRYANIWGTKDDEYYSSFQQKWLERKNESIKLNCLKEYVEEYAKEGYIIDSVKKIF